jgi:Tol biopolymer transport system component
LIGRTLSHFRITAKVGEGGMGEVYRAEDTKLGREVAIKVLPEAVASDAERLARFEREAKFLASLNHPNIASIYQVEQDGDTHFLVMELVEGATVAERLASHRLTMAEALELAGQMAKGLEYAHEHGVIHRDLKPGNLKVTPEGQLKILDFGLAKAIGSEGGDDLPDGHLSMSPTITAPPTREGVLLGTAPYMSPEQARGQVVDKRTDIWAFGCVLYEMLTGKGAFHGKTVSDVLVSVLDREPDWSALPSDLAANGRRVLERCLRKDRQQRLRDIGDARLELEESGRDQEGAPRELDRAPARSLRWLAIGSLAAFAVAIIAAIWGWTRPSTTGPETRGAVTRWQVNLQDPLRLAIGGRTNPLTISPDGSRIVFAADQRGTSQLFARDVDDFEVRPIPGTEGARNPFFSPDGKRVGFFAGTKLQTVGFDGGPPRVVAESALDDMGSSWSPDGIIVFASYGAGLSLVSAAGGEQKVLTTLDWEAGEVQHRWPQFLPGGTTVQFTVATDTGSRVDLVSLETGERRKLEGISNLTRARYVESGHLVFGHARGLNVVEFDAESGTLTGEPVSALEDVASVPDLGNAFFEISDTGTLVFVPGITTGDLELVWVDRQGRITPAVAGEASFMHPKLSPDDRQLAVSAGSEIGFRQIWVYDLIRGTRRLLPCEGSCSSPFWTPDGQEVVFSSNAAGSWDLFKGAVQGTDPAGEFVARENEQWGGSFSPDGRTFAFYDVHPETGRDIWVFDLEARESRPYLVTRFNERAPKISPDGRWMAYLSNESGLDEIYVESFPQRGRKWTISTEGGTEPNWSADGTELFYRQGDQMMVVDVSLGEDFSATKPRVLFEGRFEVGVIGNMDYDVTADSQRFLMVKRDEASGLVDLHVILNWDQELRQLFTERE